ncbi:class I glutamine amidotransferase-like protein [Podospora appendiculata]|uniref:Class I glutamine amidotransferase-like protein n=1 Tax=Podospora appendiculata TaxID=314037 RepID=A0AAE1CC36_9PEZI|nr:class I glutamine amidotransferase-like protein [Podospora appendiculata]
MAPLRLAILEADTPFPAVDAIYHGYHGVFKHLFTRAVSPTPLDSLLTLSQHDIVNDLTAYPALDAVDAILITGSKHNAFDDDPWITALVEYTRKALSTDRVRVIGVCFGHQIVGRAMGALVARADRGWEVSVTEIRTTEKGRELFGKDTLKIQQMHRDQVFSLPAGAELLAETDICPNQGFIIPGRVITIQGHPEFTEFIMDELLRARHSTGLFSDDVFQSGMDRNGDHHDGLVVARAFIKFLQQENEPKEAAHKI